MVALLVVVVVVAVVLVVVVVVVATESCSWQAGWTAGQRACWPALCYCARLCARGKYWAHLAQLDVATRPASRRLSLSLLQDTHSDGQTRPAWKQNGPLLVATLVFSAVAVV